MARWDPPAAAASLRRSRGALRRAPIGCLCLERVITPAGYSESNLAPRPLQFAAGPAAHPVLPCRAGAGQYSVPPCRRPQEPRSDESSQMSRAESLTHLERLEAESIHI